MNPVLWISVFANVLLALALVLVVRAYRREGQWARRAEREHDEFAQSARMAVDRMRADCCVLGAGVATTLESIREDLDRNYHHTHDGHVLNRVASALREQIAHSRTGTHEIRLDKHVAQEVAAMGGEITDRDSMTLGQMLSFGWRLHALSRERSDQLMIVVRQPCGNDRHAGWLSKTLAIYELMCNQDKELAIRRMSAVIDAWRFNEGPVVAHYVQDIR
ncbi:hypothetical protein [Ralstonia solanacearum]|uniref:hypothetical protein n=1 Tax=Ralstonia solanacearum TaxID=305 RepID=UPI0005ACFD88|nr:hypothetical protein [Ralstonia solanacearum]MDC6177143.1 hypothetical protein [Ralstonia solanacearum]MDC6238325.1 hypothetical protein [Ralstonia solanacearum]